MGKKNPWRKLKLNLNAVLSRGRQKSLDKASEEG